MNEQLPQPELLLEAKQLYDEVERFINAPPLLVKILQLMISLVWLMAYWKLHKALQLHDNATGSETTEFREDILRLKNEVKKKALQSSSVTVTFIILLPIAIWIWIEGHPPPTPTATVTLTPTSMVTATPTPTATPPPALLVMIEEETYEVSGSNPITIETDIGSSIRIEILLEDAGGQPLNPGLATYDWILVPIDPENEERIGSLSSVLNYTVPSDRAGQLINVTVTSSEHFWEIVIQLVIRKSSEN